MTTNDLLSWLAPARRNNPGAVEWAEYLSARCDWELEDFGGDYPWDAPIPLRNQWEDEVNALNRYLRELEA